MLVYSGSETEISVFDENLGKSGNIVMTSMKDYLGKDRSLFVDNWHTRPILFTILHLNRTNACGKKTINISQKEISFQSTESLLCMKWQNKREILMLTSSHYADVVDTQKVNYRTKLPTQKLMCSRI